MSKYFDDILSEKLKQLPVYPAMGTLWNKIEAELDGDETILKYLSELPVHEPSDKVWEVIDAHLRENHRGTIRRKFLYMAAAVALLLFLTVPWLVKQKLEIVVENEFLLSEGINTPDTFDLDNENPVEMVENLCKTGAPVCKSEAFREKVQFYLELEEELQQLEAVIDHIGGSPEIIRSVIRIENLKSDTFQELILLVHS